MQLRMLHVLPFLSLSPFPSPFPSRMENKSMGGSCVDFSFMYLLGFSSAVNWPFLSLHLGLKFVWLKHVPVISQGGFWLFLCPLMLNFLCLWLPQGRGAKGLCGPALTPGPEPEQREQNTSFLLPRTHFKEIMTFYSDFSSVVGLTPPAFKKQQSSYWKSQVWL